MKISLNEQILQEDEDMGNESPSTEEMSSSKHKQRETVIFNSSRRSSLFSAHYISNESRFSMESASIGMPIGFCPLSPVADVKDSEETDNDRFPFLRRNIPPTPTKNNDNVEIRLSPTSSPSSIGSTPINSEPIENNASQNATPSEAQVAVSVERRMHSLLLCYLSRKERELPLVPGHGGRRQLLPLPFFSLRHLLVCYSSHVYSLQPHLSYSFGLLSSNTPSPPFRERRRCRLSLES